VASYLGFEACCGSLQGQCFIFGALCPSQSGLMNIYAYMSFFGCNARAAGRGRRWTIGAMLCGKILRVSEVLHCRPHLHRLEINIPLHNDTGYRRINQPVQSQLLVPTLANTILPLLAPAIYEYAWPILALCSLSAPPSSTISSQALAAALHHSLSVAPLRGSPGLLQQNPTLVTTWPIQGGKNGQGDEANHLIERSWRTRPST